MLDAWWLCQGMAFLLANEQCEGPSCSTGAPLCSFVVWAQQTKAVNLQVRAVRPYLSHVALSCLLPFLVLAQRTQAVGAQGRSAHGC